MGRPATGQTPVQHVRVDQEDWNDLDTASGGEASEVVRQLIRHYLRRPGAKMPERPPRTEWQKVRVQQALDWFRGLGHVVDEDAAVQDDFGRPEWRCENCGNMLNLTAKGRHVSSSGNARCPRS